MTFVLLKKYNLLFKTCLKWTQFQTVSVPKVIEKLCFCLQVMLGGKNIEEGFGIAYRVIQVRFI